jgi:ferredoxin
MLRKIRIIVAWLVFIALTLVVLDFTGSLHLWLGWLAKVQLVPAILAGNAIALVAIGVLTLVFGRIYCSTLCPLGIMQDGISNVSGRRKGYKARFRYSKLIAWLRYGLLAIFVVALLWGTLGIVVSLLDPWGVFGRIAGNFFSPLWKWGNNLLAFFAERADSYAFYTVDVIVKSWIVFGVTALWLAGIAVLAWWKGRIYCNSVCPVGTILGEISRISIFRPVFDETKCTKCGVCEKACKSSCIDSKNQTIDRTRCVVCFDCLDKCKFDAMKFRAGWVKNGELSAEKSDFSEVTPLKNGGYSEKSSIFEPSSPKKGVSRRNFFSIAALAALASPAAVRAQQVERVLLQVDGGLADIIDKKRPQRKTPIVPPGAKDARNMKRHCVACQLCVSACPNNVLVPSSRLETLMQPEMTFERGYCRPECVECGEVCPAGAIEKITPADKTDISVGNAVWIADNCVVNRDNLPCTACERHCPTKAITLVPLNAEEAAKEAAPSRGRRPAILKIPVVDKTLCIGCGACENLCPARPFSAIYVEGNVTHHNL